MKGRRMGVAAAYAVLTLLSVTMLFPFFWMLMSSLKDATRLMEDRPSQISVLPVVDSRSQRCLGLIRIHDIYQPELI